MKKKTIILSLALCTTLSFSFDLNNFAKDVVNNLSNNEKTSEKKEVTNTKSTTNLSQDTVSSGLKEALKVGVNYAVETLGSKNGYLNNSQVKIPLPKNLQKVETIVRKAGGDKIADDLINSMNSAATQAAPKTAEIFVDAINKMSLEDAKNILAGDEHAATNYFKTNTNEALSNMIKPIVTKAMEDNSVAKYYDTFNSYYKEYGKEYVENSSVMNLAKNFGVDSYLPSSSDESINDYVTTKAIDGLFTIISEKEAAIRENPIEQTTSILKEVFGGN